MAEGVEELPENPKLLKLTVENGANRCVFCKKFELNELEWGVMYQLDDIVVHYFCLLFCAALKQEGQDHEGILGFLPADIKKEVRRGEKLKCKYCKIKGATLGCAVAKCKCSFHFTCGIPKGTLHHFSGSFDSYCGVHKPKVTIPVPKEMWTCGICFVDVEESENPVWPPCCKNIIYHRLCMQKYASTSGSYFFSCPHCKNGDTFVEAMKKSGVYVPERDAQWELEPGAFAELAQAYTHCDAKQCFCQHGREYEKASSSRWRMVRCDFCGSAAIHAFCGELRDETTAWKCPGCSRVVSQERQEVQCVTANRSYPEAGSSDNMSDIDSSSGNSYDDNYLIQIAARSCLVGIERESNLCHHPKEYIQTFPQVVDLNSEYDRKKKSERASVNRSTIGITKKDSHNAYKEKLVGLKQKSDICSTKLEQNNCITPDRNGLKCLSVSNLDLSEHRSKKVTMQVNLPAFLDSSLYEPLKSFKIPKCKSTQSELPDKTSKQSPEANVVRKRRAGATEHAQRTHMKINKIKNSRANALPPHLKEDIRRFIIQKIKQPTSNPSSISEKCLEGKVQLEGASLPKEQENVLQAFNMKSTVKKRIISESNSDPSRTPDVTEIEVITLVESDDDSQDDQTSSEGSPVSVVSNDDVIILSDSEDSPVATKDNQSDRVQISNELGTPPTKRIRIRGDT
ncbi:unnamed protein product [Allacma fusca]|uniref:G2/M phase-specific E3 ubiquitin-protein ligase n=1 Tax=Allacma fusca TaxID=39272 RepID=A0A8J2L423_9HEXA|nr:unnamed protein product [Allacma fusca]